MNLKNTDGTTKRNVDIAYGITTAVAVIVWPPAAIAILGAWFTDRQHYPNAKD